MDAFTNAKKAFLPEIKDWTSEYPQYKYTSEWWKLSTKNFIIFNHLGTKWFLLGVVGIGFLTFGVLGFLAFRVHWIVAVISWAVSLILLKATIQKVMTWKKAGINYTIYDMFLKE